MKCPHCSGEISMFNKDLNKWGKDKVCPQCQQPVTVSLSIVRFLMIAWPITVVVVLLNYVVFNRALPNAIAVGIATAPAFAFSWELRKRDKT